MISNTIRIQVAPNAHLDVTCEERRVGGKLRRNIYGQVARGRTFGNWATGHWPVAEPSKELIEEAVSSALTGYVVVVAHCFPEGDDLGSPIFEFTEVPAA